MTDCTAAFVHCPELEQHPYPDACPFNTSRAGMARATLAGMGLLSGGGRCEVAPTPATRDDLLRFHTSEYLDMLAEAEAGRMGVEGLAMGLGTPDCPVFVGMVDYAMLACGGTLTAARLVTESGARVAFNPSGGYHHAMPAAASGFCYINDVAIACLTMAAAGKRVVFLDIDAHHGDGVQAATYDRADVMTISFHESGRTLFPGTGFEHEIGVGDGEGYAVNIPLPVGTYDEAFLRAFHALAEPLIRSYNPDVIVMELGMDALSGDPLAHLCLSNNAHMRVIDAVRGFGHPILATGGGGYHVENTARAWALAWAALCGEETDETASLGLGGMMLESTDWMGGLRDRMSPVTDQQRAEVEPAIDAVIEKLRRSVFPYHGL